MNTLEQLEAKTSQIKNDLQALKAETTSSLEEKKGKAEQLKQEADSIKTELQQKIDGLNVENDANLQTEKEKAEQLLQSLEEVTDLYNDIVGDEIQTDQEDTSGENMETTGGNNEGQTNAAENNNSSNSESKDEEKTFFGKAKDWIGDQWTDVWNKEKWKSDGGKNLLRTLGFAATGVGAVALAYKGIKKLFGGGDDEEEIEENKETKKKKGGILNKLGKVLKWSAIGVGGALGINRLGKKLGRRGTEANATSSAKEQVKSTEKLKEEDPEKFEKYHGLGENIDSQYNQLMEKEIAAGWGGVSIADGYKKYCDSSKLSLEDFKATVPMCIDNQFSSVSNMLSEAGYYAYLRTKNFKELKEAFLKMLSDGSEKLLGSMTPFFGCLKSFEKYKNKDFLEGIKIWLDDGAPTERCEELQLFFRQYAKVINYAQDKRLALVEKIAKKKLDAMEAAGEDTSKYATPNDAINDEKWFEENIKSDSDYVNFMEGKLSNAIDVMKKESLFDDNLSEGVKEIKVSVDSYRAEVLKEQNGKDSLGRLKENKGSLKEDNYNEGIEVVDNVCKDIDDYFEKERTYMYFGAAHTLLNTDEKNKQEFLENSGLKTVKNDLKSKLLEYKTKFKNKNITADEVEGYSDLVNSYFAMKKEVMVAANAIQTMKSNDASVVDRLINTGSAILHDLYAQGKKAYESAMKGDIFEAWLYSTFPLIAAGGATKFFGRNNKVAKKIGNILLKSNAIGAVPGAAQGAYKLWGNVVRRTSHIEGLPDWALVHGRYNIEHGDELLFQDILEGRISGTKAENIIKKGKWEKKRGKAKNMNSLEEFLKTVGGLDSSTSGRVLSDLFKTRVEIGGKQVEISFMKNEEIRKIICGSPTGKAGKMKSVFNGYYRRIYGDFSKMEGNAKHLGFGELFGWAEGGTSKIKNLSENQLIFLKKIVEDGNFTDPTKQLKNLLENIDKIELKGVTEDGLVKIIEEIGSNATDLEDIAKIQNKVNKFRGVDTISPERLSQPVFSEIDNTKGVLQDELNKSTNAAKRNQIQKQIDQLEEFKNEMGKMSDVEFKKMDSLMGCFELNGTRKSLNEIITDITKLKKIMDSGSHLTVGEKGVTKSIDDIIRNLDADSLRKAIKFNSGIANELEDVAKIFEHMKIKSLKNMLGNADDILKGVKMLVKFVAKAT